MKQQVIFVCYFTLLKNLYGYVITQVSSKYRVELESIKSNDSDILN